MAWTRSGSISLTNGSAVVYGSGTTWVSGGLARSGDTLKAPDGKDYEVLSVQSNTQLTLVSGYLGSTASGQAYALVHTGLLPSEIALAISSLQSKYLTTVAQLYEWETSVADTVPITNPATGVTSNVKPLQRFLASLTDGSSAGVFSSLASSGVVSIRQGSGTFRYLDESGGFLGDMNVLPDGSMVFRNTASVIERLRISASGNNGFGEVPADWGGGSNIDLGSGVSISFGSNGGVIASNAYYNNGWKYKTSNFATKYDQQQGSGIHAWYSAPSGSAGGAVDFVPVASLDSVAFLPGSDNVRNLGSSGLRWGNLYLSNNPIVTSDARLKSIRGDLTEAEISAWEAVRWVIFRWQDAVEVKGDAARQHAGLIAQEVQAAFEAQGLDARAYGLWCADKITEEIEIEDGTEVVDVPVMRDVDVPVRSVEIVDGVPTLVVKIEQRQEAVAELKPVMDGDGRPVIVDGQPMLHPVPVTEKQTIQKTRKTTVDRGERLGLRMEQCFAFESAYSRSRLVKAEERIAALEGA